MIENDINALVARHAAMERKYETLINESMSAVSNDNSKIGNEDFAYFNKKLYRYKFLKNENNKMLKESVASSSNNAEITHVEEFDLCNGILYTIGTTFKEAVTQAFAEDLGNRLNKVDFAVYPADKRTKANFQYNSAMKINALLKECGKQSNPKAVAEKVLSLLPTDHSLIEKVEVSGPGYINIYTKSQPIRTYIEKVLSSGIDAPINDNKKHKTIVDFSSPNIAKEMHVGHLRSTIIGDVIARMYEYCNFNVLRLNHLGDWGTQFGMLIAYLEERYPEYAQNPPSLNDLVSFYKEAKKRFDSDDIFKRKAYDMVVKLQAKNPDIYAAWQHICTSSRDAYTEIYRRLDISIIDRGESFYNGMMNTLVEDLKNKNLLKEDEGRLILWPEGIDVPLTIVKSDGGFTYDTSDLTALKQRLDEEKADIIIYVVDAGQGMHLRSIYQVAKQLGWYDSNVKTVKHVDFGLVLGSDNKKFKTRSGDTVRLVDLLDEGVQRARQALIDRGRLCTNGENDPSKMSEQELYEAEQSLAYGCIKYADLATSREKDYVFSFDRMLDDRGNTAVYLLYSFVRVRSMIRHSGLTRQQIVNWIKTKEGDSIGGLKLAPESDENEIERALMIHMVKLGDAIRLALENQTPHVLCDYAFELAQLFSSFYNECKCVETVNGKATEVRIKRLMLAEAVGDHMLQVFNILGIRPINKM